MIKRSEDIRSEFMDILISSHEKGYEVHDQKIYQAQVIHIRAARKTKGHFNQMLDLIIHDGVQSLFNDFKCSTERFNVPWKLENKFFVNKSQNANKTESEG